MNWYHEVNKDWLEARLNYITATEIAKLVPAYKRSLKLEEGAIAPEFAALWAEKVSSQELDTVSYGAAARGHVMEWYAVESWNAKREDKLYHWDDAIITKGIVGFSPDAMNESQVDDSVEFVARDHEIRSTSVNYPQPKYIMEVKAYEPAHHMKCLVKDKMEQDELVQIAVAFYVLDYLEEAHLCFYCPSAPISMKVFSYTRDDLEVEIELVSNIVERYRETVKQCNELSSDLVSIFTEKEIYDAMIEEVELNRKDNVFGF